MWSKTLFKRTNCAKYKDLIMGIIPNSNVKSDNYMQHILEIFYKVNNKYNSIHDIKMVDVLKHKLYVKYLTFIKNLILNHKEDTFMWDDKTCDVCHKLSLYQKCSYMNHPFILEAAIGVTSSFLSYNGTLLTFMNSTELNILRKQDILKIIIDSFKNHDFTKGVLNITGYSTWFRLNKSFEDLSSYIPCTTHPYKFNQDPNSSIIFVDDVKRTDGLIIQYPYRDDDSIIQLTTDQFNLLRQYEERRPKHYNDE